MGLFLRQECIAWFCVVALSLAVRIFSRVKLRGSWKKLQRDDYLMVVSCCNYTALSVLVNIIIVTRTNLMTDDERARFTADEVPERQFGSKLVLVAEVMSINTIWGVKGCLLCMYHRMMKNSKFLLWLRLLIVYVVVAYFYMQVMYLGVWCRPITEYWRVPTDKVQCNAQTHHLINNFALNVSSDIMIFVLPIPFLWDIKMPLRKKIGLSSMFLLGIVTITSAILNKYYSFTEPFSDKWTYWYIRESSTALLVANVSYSLTLVHTLYERSRVGRSASTRNTHQNHCSADPEASSVSPLRPQADVEAQNKTESEPHDSHRPSLTGSRSTVHSEIHEDLDLTAFYTHCPGDATYFYNSTVQSMRDPRALPTPPVAIPLQIWRQDGFAVTRSE